MTMVTTMTEREAHRALGNIQKKLEQGLDLMAAAKEMVEQFDANEGWRVLGYRSLAACLAKELDVQRAKAYRILDEVRGRQRLLGTPAQAAGPSTRTRASAVRTVDREPDALEGDVLGVDPGDQENAPSSRVINGVEMIVDAERDEWEAITPEQWAVNRESFHQAKARLDFFIAEREA